MPMKYPPHPGDFYPDGQIMLNRLASSVTGRRRGFACVAPCPFQFVKRQGRPVRRNGATRREAFGVKMESSSCVDAIGLRRHCQDAQPRKGNQRYPALSASRGVPAITKPSPPDWRPQNGSRTDRHQRARKPKSHDGGQRRPQGSRQPARNQIAHAVYCPQRPIYRATRLGIGQFRRNRPFQRVHRRGKDARYDEHRRQNREVHRAPSEKRIPHRSRDNRLAE